MDVPAQHPEPAPTDRTAGGAHRVAAAVTGLQGIVLVGFALFYAYEIAIGASSDVQVAIGSGVIILLSAVALLVLARGLQQGSAWARTPTILVNLLLLPVAWTLGTGGQPGVGVLVGVVALVGLVSAAASPGRTDLPE